MSLNTNFNVNPYYDDFDEDKKFLRMLFKPGYAVQARELTQLQTILQNQVKRFGNNIFKNGSLVTGGQTFIQDATYLKLSTDYAGSAVVVGNFTNYAITNLAGTKKAEVVVSYDANAGTGDPKTLLVKQIYGDAFTSSETIQTIESAPAYANIATSGVGTGQIFSVSEGVFYYDGFFIKNNAQTIALSKYDNTSANVRIGFEIQESTVVYTQDTSLLDPAQDASNFQAPGSDRYKINLVLASRSLTSTDDTQFIELARVESGVLVYANKYPLYAVLEDTLARRTYDESGNYTVRPFKLSLETSAANTAKANVTLSPGKAYVYGYEFETIAPTTISVDKPRTTDSVTNKRLSADYGYYVYSNTHYGSLPINSLQTVDLHCISNSSINVSSTGTISNTKIGTARIKSIEFETAANTSNSATYEYRTYLFDVAVGSITGGNCNNGIAVSNTTYLQLANTLSGSALYSTVDNAYTGAKIRITAGPGVGETPKTITNYKGSTQTVQITQPFIANVNSASTWAIDFGFNDVQSMAITSSTTRVAAADIDGASKDPATIYFDTIISDTKLEPLIFTLGQNYVANSTIANLSFSYKRLYESQSFSSSVSPALSVGTGESVSAATSTASKNEKYQIAVTSAGTSPYTVGQIIPANLFTVDTGTRKLTITNANNMVANITATIDSSNPSAKTKTYVGANSTVQTSSGTSIFANNGIVLYASQGQTHIMANTLIKTVDTPQSLFVSDVVDLVSVLDFNGYGITSANTAFATQIVSKYALDNGQRDSYYGHAAIKLIPGNTPPTGPLVISYNRFSSSGAGFFDVDSYNGYAYGSIPTFTSKATGQIYNLRDSLDFRPVRATPTSAATANTVTFDVDSTTTGPKIPENGSDIILNYQYYLPRIDKVALNKNRTFEVIQGVPSLTPVEPKDKDGAMTLYVLHEPAYVANTSDIAVQYIDNRRFTMRDIGSISKRVENLEYYTSLSLLEQSAVNKQDLTILDSTNLPRFKNGILVDSFNGHSVADVSNRDYKAAIDPNIKELRPSFNISSSLLTFDAANSTNYVQSGPIITANSTQTVFVDQNKASRSFNINPFNVINYLGKINLDPPSDIWIATDKKPDVLVNLQGDKDAWNLILQSTYNYEWGDWSTYWTGQSVSGGAWQGTSGGGAIAIIGSQTVTTTSAQTRSGVATNVVASTITQSLGDRVIDASIIPYMRNRNVLFTGSSFKPTTTLYGFFDNADVNNNIVRLNKFTLNANNLQYQTQVSNLESVTIYNNTTSTSNGTALIALTSNTEAFIVSVNPYTAFNIASANLVGTVSGSSIRINGYDHYNGNAASAAANTITLRVDATGANNISTYVGSPIYIVSGTGSNQKRTISAYNSTTRVASVNTNWTTVPDSTSIYSIGNLTTTVAGDIAGLFYIPNGQFRVGEKHFRLIDTTTGDIASSSTNGDASFFAQGLLQQTENTIISTTVPTIQRVAVNDNRVVTSTTSRAVVVGYYDPLAQTFLVSQNDYPDGLFLSKARFCFKSKDASQPITLQLRSTVNGYPSSSVVFPYSTVTLTPDQIKTSLKPNLDDADTYTDFVFDAPIYVQPGEYAFVLMTNSKGYETYAAEVGAVDTVTGRQISSQPYGGSLFLSQNGSTWVAEQNSDMMFRMYRHTFNTGITSAKFKVDYPSANTPYDLLHLMTSEVVLGNTSVTYTFNSEKATGGMAGNYSITPFTDYPMYDGADRRVMNPTTGNSTLTVTATMFTNNPDITPFLDASRYGVIAVENIINNLPLSNAGIVLSNGGAAYSTNANAVVTITGGGGSGATAAAVVTSNVVTSIYLTNLGSGYETSPTFTLVDANTTPGTGVVVSYNGEDKKSGGNSNVRYITRKVTLADGFDSGDLRVYLTTYKPSGSNIRVYYKLLSTSDADEFDNKGYQLMTQLSNTNFVSNSPTDYREIAYAPGYNGTANNAVNYVSGSTTFNSFRTFAIKIVMTGTSTTDVPKVRDFRAIALPAGN
jgi:hypothetical protein